MHPLYTDHSCKWYTLCCVIVGSILQGEKQQKPCKYKIVISHNEQLNVYIDRARRISTAFIALSA